MGATLSTRNAGGCEQRSLHSSNLLNDLVNHFVHFRLTGIPYSLNTVDILWHCRVSTHAYFWLSTSYSSGLCL